MDYQYSSSNLSNLKTEILKPSPLFVQANHCDQSSIHIVPITQSPYLTNHWTIISQENETYIDMGSQNDDIDMDSVNDYFTNDYLDLLNNVNPKDVKESISTKYENGYDSEGEGLSNDDYVIGTSLAQIDIHNNQTSSYLYNLEKIPITKEIFFFIDKNGLD